MFRRRLPLLVVALAAVASAAAAVRWDDLLAQPAEWYAGAEARRCAASILQYQTESGGWPKNVDMTSPPSAEFLASPKFDHRAPTIDNGATTTQLEYLARVISARDDGTLRAAFDRGFNYLLAAQYPNGGWPQYFPLIEGYYSHITYNDGAMVNVLELLHAVKAGREPFAFVAMPGRERAATAVLKGIDCILRTQVKQDGQRTVWCAQHDERTLAPAWARNFEPPALSAMESVGIVRLLMQIESPGNDLSGAIEGAVAWFKTAAIQGLRLDESPGADGKRDRRAVADPAAPALWARFYELGTNRPIYAGRDRVIHYAFNEIERERRTGYSYLGDWPAKLLAKDYPRWRTKNKLP